MLLIQPGQFISRTETLKGTELFGISVRGNENLEHVRFITWKAAHMLTWNEVKNTRKESEIWKKTKKKKNQETERVLSFTHCISKTLPGWWWWPASGWKASLWCSCRSVGGPRWCWAPQKHSTSPPRKDEIYVVSVCFTYLCDPSASQQPIWLH